MKYEAFINLSPDKFLSGVTKIAITYEGGIKEYEPHELHNLQIVGTAQTTAVTSDE